MKVKMLIDVIICVTSMEFNLLNVSLTCLIKLINNNTLETDEDTFTPRHKKKYSKTVWYI